MLLLMPLSDLKMRTKHFMPLTDNSTPLAVSTALWPDSHTQTAPVTYHWPSLRHLAVMSLEESRSKRPGTGAQAVAFLWGLNLEFPEQDYAEKWKKPRGVVVNWYV